MRPICQLIGCKCYGSSKKYGRSCYAAGPQCLVGQLDLLFDVFRSTMPGPRERDAIPIPLFYGPTPLSGLPLTAVEHAASHSVPFFPQEIHGDHNDTTALSRLAVVSSSDVNTPTNPSAGEIPPSPAITQSSHACDAGAFTAMPNCLSCETSCEGRRRRF